jgi:hypothetical protein
MFKFTKLFTLLLLLNLSCAYALDTPTEDFIDNKDGTVTHKKTGLTWQRCSVGQTWTGASCSGTASTYTFDQANALTSNFAGRTDWRLPRIDELNSITEYGKYSPAINTAIFPNTPIDSWIGFWSSTNGQNFDVVWIVNTVDGGIGAPSKTNKNIVRLVSGSKSLNSSSEYTPVDDFINNQDGTVTHNKTGLMWQRCPVGMNLDNSICAGILSKITYDVAKSTNSNLANYNDWRIPTMGELHTIVEYKNSPLFSQTLNNNVFPYITDNSSSSNLFWTSSAFANDPNKLWVIYFGNGSDYLDYKINSVNSLRLVRGTWSAPTSTPVLSTKIDLSTMLSQPTSRIQQNTSVIYTATVTNNGTGTANNSLLKIYLPPRNVLIVSMPSDCVTTGKSITCSLGSLAAGASVTRLLKVSYTKSGGSSVSALVLTDSDDTNSANNVSRIVTAITK